MNLKTSTSSKTVTFDNDFIDYLIKEKSIKYQHINLLVYLKDRATLKEGGYRFIKEITLNEINTFLNGDAQCRTTKKLVYDLVNLELIYIQEDIKLTPKKVFSITLDGRITQSKRSFTVVPEALLHKYSIGISTYMAIRKYHSEVAKMSIPQIQKLSKVSKRELQYKIIKDLEELDFVDILRGGYNNANTYICTDYSKIEFERLYNKFKPSKKNIVKNIVMQEREYQENLIVIGNKKSL